VAAQPFAEGNHWRATKGPAVIDLIGTFHAYDPRMAAIAARLQPLIAAADATYVEATEAELAALQAAVTRQPELAFFTTGPTLPELLPEADWQRLMAAMRDRGLPVVLGAKMRPWMLSTILALPPCAMPAPGETRPEGLDLLVMTAARAAGKPLAALEPWDTALQLFNATPLDEQIAMLRATLPLLPQAEDLFLTMADAYFAERPLRLWELNRQLTLDTAAAAGMTEAEALAGFDDFAGLILTDRNRRWIDRLRAETGDGSAPVHLLVAVGAAHLPGETGLAALLAAEGWQLERQPF
jgi:uncharacterized protein YbaP (TraB family)